MRPVLVCSLGNPGLAYANTRHSAGHVLLRALVRAANAPALRKEATFKGSLSSVAPDFIFWRSESYMNESGRGVAAAWRAFTLANTPSTITDAHDAATQPQLVILHDELELNLGHVKISHGAGRSARGHNGLKSMLSMPGMSALDFWRVGVGIGPRPVGRGKDEVAGFVLQGMKPAESQIIDGLAVPLLDALDAIRADSKNVPSKLRSQGA